MHHIYHMLSTRITIYTYIPHSIFFNNIFYFIEIWQINI